MQNLLNVLLRGAKISQPGEKEMIPSLKKEISLPQKEGRGWDDLLEGFGLAVEETLPRAQVQFEDLAEIPGFKWVASPARLWGLRRRVRGGGPPLPFPRLGVRPGGRTSGAIWGKWQGAGLLTAHQIQIGFLSGAADGQGGGFGPAFISFAFSGAIKRDHPEFSRDPQKHIHL